MKSKELNKRLYRVFRQYGLVIILLILTAFSLWMMESYRRSALAKLREIENKIEDTDENQHGELNESDSEVFGKDDTINREAKSNSVVELEELELDSRFVNPCRTNKVSGKLECTPYATISAVESEISWNIIELVSISNDVLVMPISSHLNKTELYIDEDNNFAGSPSMLILQPVSMSSPLDSCGVALKGRHAFIISNPSSTVYSDFIRRGGHPDDFTSSLYRYLSSVPVSCKKLSKECFQDLRDKENTNPSGPKVSIGFTSICLRSYSIKFPDQVLLINEDELLFNPKQVVSDVFSFLGIQNYSKENDIWNLANKASEQFLKPKVDVSLLDKFYKSFSSNN